MGSILHTPVSGLHLLAALTAMGAGTYVLLNPKGTPAHRLMGRVYVVAMVVLLLTAFGIYALFGRFGVIHWGAAGSVAALLLGTMPVVGRSVIADWLRWHYVGMGASVTGLYAAFLVESTYRLFPSAYFWWVTMGAANAVFVTGTWLLYRHWPLGTVSAQPRARQPRLVGFKPRFAPARTWFVGKFQRSVSQ